MNRARIDKMRKGHLMNAAKSLVIWMGDDAENEGMIDCDKAIYRVIDDFANKCHGCCLFVKPLLTGVGKATIAEFNKLNLAVADEPKHASVVPHASKESLVIGGKNRRFRIQNHPRNRGVKIK